jgi:hypothetical protein
MDGKKRKRRRVDFTRGSDIPTNIWDILMSSGGSRNKIS